MINGLKEKIIWVFWTGENDMSSARKKCLSTLKEKSGCKVIVISPANLKEYEAEDDPFHEGFSMLSLTHKSDYLRSYFMHHYGGAYSDIKAYSFDWRPYFVQLEESGKDFIGAREEHEDHVASQEPLIRQAYNELASVRLFIFKPKCKFSKIWKDATTLKMDSILQQLRVQDGSYHPRAVFIGAQGDASVEGRGYPLTWNELLGGLFHPLQYNNSGRALFGLPNQQFVEVQYR